MAYETPPPLKIADEDVPQPHIMEEKASLDNELDEKIQSNSDVEGEVEIADYGELELQYISP